MNNLQRIPDLEEALLQADQSLIGMELLKSTEELTEDGPWMFQGVASDESEDVEGDNILRKALDVTYAARRGYVNWDHGKGPEDQIGYLTRCEVLTPSRIEELSKSNSRILKTSTVFVEGELYKHVPKAAATYKLLKSIPDGAAGPGLSLDGTLARNRQNLGIVKAFVRGVAITPAPAHPSTIAQLKKSLMAYDAILRAEGELPVNLPAVLAKEVVAELRKNMQPASGGMTHDEAVLFVLRKRPRWTYELASKLVRYTQQQLGRGA